jgi:ferrous iron transport protein B
MNTKENSLPTDTSSHEPTPGSAKPAAKCETCPAYQGGANGSSASLRKLGIDTSGCDHVIALAGNPNVGKSTIFNVLTGLRQHVGNWTGKTVARMEGAFRFNDLRYKIVDLPGTYSLLANSADEEIARDFILFGRPSVTVVVTDATRLERNLNLALQVLEITDHVVVALNLIDEAARAGLTIDERRLTRDHGVPVVPMAARRGVGVPELLRAIDEVARGIFVCRPHRIRRLDDATERAIADIQVSLDALFPGLPNARWVAMRLLDGDPSIIREVHAGTLGSISHSVAAEEIRKQEQEI